jgi:hypothetical protein
MERRYTLILNFKAKIADKSTQYQQEKFENFAEFLEEFLNNNEVINSIYRNLLICDFLQENNIFGINHDKIEFEITDENILIRKVIETLKGNSRKKFHELMERKDKKTNEFIEEFFGLCGELKLNGFKFISKN